jgi:hypothetical protein
MVAFNPLCAIGRTAGVPVRLLFVEDVETDAELAVQRLHLPGTRTARPRTWAGEGGELMSSLVFAIAANAEDDSSVTGRARPCNCVTYPATTLA